MKNRATKMVVKIQNKCTTKKAKTIKPKLVGEK